MYGKDLETRILSLGDELRRDPKRWDRLCRKYPECSDTDLGNPGEMTVRRLAYFAERIRGVEHVWAAMTASRKGPALGTDVSLFQGYRCLGDQYGEKEIKQLVSNAKAFGYTPGQHDVYIASLASFPGDPAAFVPATGGRGHINKILEQRNWSCQGVVNREAECRREGPVIPDGPQLADDLALEKAVQSGLLNERTKSQLPDILSEMRNKHGLSSQLVGDAGPLQHVTPHVEKITTTKPRRKRNGTQ